MNLSRNDSRTPQHPDAEACDHGKANKRNDDYGGLIQFSRLHALQ
jgi:hypothetical protein